MKRFCSFAFFSAIVFSGLTTYAQQEESPSTIKKEKREIIIRNNNDEEQRIIVQMDGDAVTINGKPIDGERNGNVIIRKFNFDDVNMENGMLKKLEEESDSSAFLGVMTMSAENGGAEITDVSENSAAAKAGLKEDDVIIKMAGQPIEDSESLVQAVQKQKPNDQVEIVFLRNGKEKKTTATLQLKKASRKKIVMMQQGVPLKKFELKDPTGKPKLDEMDINVDIAELIGEDFLSNDNGFSYSFSKKEKLGLKLQDTENEKGVKVLEITDNSLASKSGLEKDDIIIDIDGKTISNTDEARIQFKLKEDKNTYKVKVDRKGSVKTFEITRPKKLKTIDL
jgi:serine protease Do